MLTLYIIINLIDLQCLFIIFLVAVKLNSGLNVDFIFTHKTTTINLVTIAKFIHIICKEVLFSLFINEYHDRKILKPVLLYFETVKKNGYNIFHLYFLL